MNSSNSMDSSASIASSRYDVVIVGGGAAGLMAGYWAAKSGATCLILESSKACGLKILISGGGRCNILPSKFKLDDYYTKAPPKLLNRLFKTWPLKRLHTFFEEDLNLKLTLEAETGKIFPASQKAREVRDVLVSAFESLGGEILTRYKVNELIKDSEGDFEIRSLDGRKFRAKKVILASGGLSLPKTGSDGHGYRLARRFDHSIESTYPALVPLRSQDQDLLELSGISLVVNWAARLHGKQVQKGSRDLLFTHRGLSGPAALDLSHWFTREGATIELSWLGHDRDYWNDCFAQAQSKNIGQVLAESSLPKRLIQYICKKSQVEAKTQLAQMPKKLRQRLLTNLCEFELPICGDEGYAKAEVTGGGVGLEQLHSKSLESKNCEGLYMCGEIIDVIGRIGGYNFLWAWVSGRLAGQAAATS